MRNPRHALPAIFLALALLLASCGQAAVVPTKPETATERELTTEPAPTEPPFVHTSGESNGVGWRTLD